MPRRAAALRRAPVARLSSAAGLGPLGLGREFLQLQGVEAAAVGADHLEAKMVDRRRLAALGQPPERLEDQPAHGIELLVAEVALERLVEVSDFGLRLDPVAAISLGDD